MQSSVNLSCSLFSPLFLKIFFFKSFFRYYPFMSKPCSGRLKIYFAWYRSSDLFLCIFIFNQDSAFCSICINHCPFPFSAQLWMINKTRSSLWTCNTSYFSSDLFCTFSILQGWHGTSQQNTISTLTLLLFQRPCFLEQATGE